MKPSHFAVSVAVSLCTTAFCGLPQAAIAQAAMQPPSLSASGIPFRTGGVGEEEAAEMKRVSKDYNLRLLFAAKNGEYLAGVQVKLESSQGAAVLETTSQGPYFLVQLPSGSYRVTVSYQAQSQVRTVQVAAGSSPGQELKFTW